MKNFKKVLIANRGEIAIRIIRACHELGIRTVAIYSYEDRYALFRTKSDESYLIGKNKGPIEAYLGIDEIIGLALKKGVDAIHPGYGFLAENADFSAKCEKSGITFIGPTAEMINNLGDKIQSKIVAKSVNVPTIPGVERPIKSDEEAIEFARACGFPIMLKASAGGGGRGMRIVRDEKELLAGLHNARNEARKAFGNDDIFMEKYLDNPKHIEVQILGDNYGNLVHLYERDCSIQRRHQKVIEFTPALSISDKQREAICADALKIAKAVNYRNAGTVEFLVDSSGQHYFIEMNPRIQVEHTITEMVTGIDIVQSQILIAQGYRLDSEEVGIKSQEFIKPRGYAIQCRITTEDPANSFAPDTGRIDVYRTGSGPGIRLDGGNGYTGSVISPYYDSLLVKIISFSRTFEDAINKAKRSIRELVVSGVKTNDGFLLNVLSHPTFVSGNCGTNFIEQTPELFDIAPKDDKEVRLLKYFGEKAVNETKGNTKEYNVPYVPHVPEHFEKNGTKQILDKEGPDGVVRWIKSQSKLLMTDTSFRDAHQSLMATRLRTYDMLKISRAVSYIASDLFSVEMWGGATYDVAYRFLKEDPWKRLEELRKKIPNILFQMLLRGANAVGYTNYPDNLVREFIREAAAAGIDVFRIFDSLNWIKGMEVALDETLKTGKIAEACICYTGDILDPRRDKYTLEYYVKKAKELEKMGTHILGIKDMSGLLKPYAAEKLIKTLKQEIGIPIHLHTHDTSGNAVATVLLAAEAGVDIVDACFNNMSGVTSQPALNSIVAALKHTERDPGFDLDALQEIADYWEDVRPMYSQFESDLKSGTAEVYKYEIPGGQYSNLKSQVESFGLGHKFKEVKEMYMKVNFMMGDIVKVTPSSKMVGDLAIFMVKNELTPENILEKGKDLAFPDSVVSYFEGMMGQPEGGFSTDLQQIVLKGKEPITCRPGELLPPVNFEELAASIEKKHGFKPTKQDLLSFALYPKVFDEYIAFIKEYGDFSRMETPLFFEGLKRGVPAEVELEDGKIYIIQLVQIGKLDNEGMRPVVFEVNGNRREIKIPDKTYRAEKVVTFTQMADPQKPGEIGASIPGNVFRILVKEGDEVKEGDSLLIIEAMKMETNVVSPIRGTVTEICVKEGQRVKTGELLLKIQ
ncbi:MAG: 2-oxoglutarate carboxylase small subunit [Spirochaetes bacterium ADurb.Bin218]|nr:MAG: 2-oxoglutarate carboxylase small subunit [Spirochaetes bacterium ADurb.Bin218]